MAFSILKFFQPKDKVFQNLFEETAEISVRISELFLEAMKATDAKRFEILAQTGHLEHQADQVTHKLYVELSKNFITPFDREDIHALASAMDDVVDYIDEVGLKMKNYEFTEFNDYVLKIAELNNESVKELKSAISELRDMKNLSKVTAACLNIHGYESKVDVLYNQAMGDLIKNEKDNPVKIIVMKDLFEELELISDKCQDVSNVIESIVIKYS
jgi:predicted phosphate transport protein (TIGR00153 family)